MSISNIVELSGRIAANTTKVNDYLVANNLPLPSFDVDAPLQSLIPDTEQDIAAARQSVIHDCKELRLLMLGPKEHVTSYSHSELVSQQAITRFRLAHAFPIGSETTFADLAVASGLGETQIRKLVRHAISQHIFCEPRAGVVAHTAASRLLAENEVVHNWIEYNTHEMWHSSYRTVDAMEKFPGSEEPNETGYAVANQTDKSMFAFLSQHPDRLKRFAAAMRFYAERPGFEPQHIAKHYPWGSLPDGATIVDVGGSHGIASFAIAHEFPHLKFVVQDLDEPVIRDSEEKRPAELADRVAFMVHDFFTEQPVKGADVYLFRAVLHNWADKYAVRILQKLIPALKPGAKVVVSDVVGLAPGDIPKALEARVRTNDLSMMSLQNSGDREMGDWERLFKLADDRFEFQGGTKPPSSTLWTLVAEWKGN